MDRQSTGVVDPQQLAQRMSDILNRSFMTAKMIDRGAYASVYQLIESHASSKIQQSAIVVRVSCRPVYHDVAIDEERQKIKTYVATLNVIHASAPKQVQRRVPRVLAYDASRYAEFGHGWIAMTRMAGTSLAECWLEFGLEQRRRAIEELASFTRKLARFKVSGEIGSIATVASSSRSCSVKDAHRSISLSLPRRNGANNLRPVNNRSSKRHLSTASFLEDAVEAEVAFLREHQKAAVRCFNMNMVRLRQCGLDEEIPVDAAFGSTTSSLYKKKLRALGQVAQSVVGSSSVDTRWEPERFVLAHLDMSSENVLVDPDTGAVLGIVDWEFAGFVPDWLALAAPSWISDEWLPSWTVEEGWTMDGEECERDPFELYDESYAIEMDILRRTWTKEVTWEDHVANIGASKEKRLAWKACLTEWHQLERACAWARTIVEGDCNSFDMDSAVSDTETTQSETDHNSNCSPSTVESSLGPQTPIDALSRSDLPCSADRFGLRLDIKFDEDEDEDEDAEEDSGEEIVEDDIDFDDFAASFAPPPLPHFSAPTVTITVSSPLAKIPFNLPTMPTHHNHLSTPVRSTSGSRWSVFWETPKVDVHRDLEFVLERDLDAGW